MQNAASHRRGFAAPRLLDMPVHKSEYNLLSQVPAGLPQYNKPRNVGGQHQPKQQIALEDHPLNRSRAGCRRQLTEDRHSFDLSSCIDGETLNYQGSKPKLVIEDSCSFSSNNSRIPYAEARSPRARELRHQLFESQNFNVGARDPEWAPSQRPGYVALKPAHSSTDHVADQGFNRGAPCAWSGERNSAGSSGYGGRKIYSSSAGLQRQSSGSSFEDSFISGDFPFPTLSPTVSLNASDSAFFNALYDEGWKHDDAGSNKQAEGSAKNWAQQTEESYNLQLTFALRLTAEASLTEELHFLDHHLQETPNLSSSRFVTKSVEAVSYRFWINGSLSYHDKIQDGFYYIWGMNPHIWTICSDWEEGGQMPSLESLRGIDASDSSMEVILIDKRGDSHLRELENRALGLAYGCTSTNEVIEQLGKLVCMLMGGPSSTEHGDLMMRWKVSSKMLKDCLNCIVIPIGSLSVGLCRHRALLFKALADIIDLPCRIARGCKYCGFDCGSSCLAQCGVGREYLVDLIGKPGALCDADSIVNGPSSLSISSPLCIPEFKSSQVIDEVQSLIKQYASDNKYLEVLFSNMGCKPQAAGQKEESTIDLDVTPLESATVPPVVAPVMEITGIQPFVQGANISSVGDISLQKLVIKCPVEGLTETADGILVASECVVSPGVNVTEESTSRLLSAATGEPAKLHAEDKLRKDSENIDSQMSAKSKPNVKSLLQDYKQRDVHAKPKDEECLEQRCLQVCKLRDVHGKAGDAECRKRMILQTLNHRDVQCKLEASYQETDKSKDGRLEEAEGVLSRKANLELSLAMDGLEIPWEDLSMKERIGAGSFGTVHHADWHGSDVAVKILIDQDFHEERLKEFLREVAIMKRLRHPNVVLFMGAVTKRPNLSIVTEYLPRGSLYRLLRRQNVRELLDERRCLRMALDVAKGINYLHRLNPPIVHRDLKSPNLLVDKTWTVKVCDFGLSRFKANTFLSSKSAAGTPEWMAPEVLRDEPSNEKSDVYSFGVILWELVTMQQPWSGLSPAQVVGAVGFQNRRLLIPQDMNPAIATIIESCWANDPRQRPSFASIMESLKPLVKAPAAQPISCGKSSCS